MNICFLYGKIISEIDFKFVYNSKKYISVVKFEIEIQNNFHITTLPVFAYNELADEIYSEYEKNNFVMIVGRIENNNVNILEAYK